MPIHELTRPLPNSTNGAGWLAFAVFADTLTPSLGSDDAFHQAIKDHKLVMIDFFATWCGPCRVIAPFIEKHSTEDKYKDIYFTKIDVDKLYKLSDDLDIQAMPTLVMFKDGERSDTILDPNPKTLVEFLDKAV